MSWLKGVVAGMVLVAWVTTASADRGEVHRGQLKSIGDAAPVSAVPLRADIDKPARRSPLGITRVRLDPPPPGEREDSAVLRFHLSNTGASTLTDIVFEVSVVEEPQREHLDTLRRVLAGPFAIRGKIVLDPGYTADCEILLHHISPACRCTAKVRVLSFRSIGGSGP